MVQGIAVSPGRQCSPLPTCRASERKLTARRRPTVLPSWAWRVERKSTMRGRRLPCSGVGAEYSAVHPEFHLTAGRMFQPGLRELIAGKSRYELFKNFEIGDHVRLR